MEGNTLKLAESEQTPKEAAGSPLSYGIKDSVDTESLQILKSVHRPGLFRVLEAISSSK